MLSSLDRNHIAIIFVYSFLTACACGLGALPFFFLKDISTKGIGIAKSIAAGLMIAASFAMINQGISYSVWAVFFGIMIGMAIIMLAKNFVQKREKHLHFDGTSGKTAGQLVLFLAIMTIHSGTEGIAM